MNETGVLIVDDHAMLRSGLRLLLEGQPDITVVGEAGDGLEAIRLAREIQPDVILLDLTMPGMHGLDVLQKLLELDPNASVVVTTADIQNPTRQLCMQMDARGFVSKPVDQASLLLAIRTAALTDSGDACRFKNLS